jgi:hypothetical protein
MGTSSPARRSGFQHAAPGVRPPDAVCRVVRARRLPPVALAALVCLAAASPAGGQSSPVSRLACGAYEAVPSGTAAHGRPTRLSIQKSGRLLLTVSDWSITRVDCADMEGDHAFELLVTTSSGGAHCCETLHVWALDQKPRKLLEYPAGNAGGFERRDLDGDGRQELLLGDDTFAYFGDLCYACSPSNVPMVACRTPRGFEDCTRRYPDLLRATLARFTERLRPPQDESDAKFVEGAALGALAVWSLLGEEEKGLEAIRGAVGSDEVMKWLERARPQVRDWVSARGRRLKDGR